MGFGAGHSAREPEAATRRRSPPAADIDIEAEGVDLRDIVEILRVRWTTVAGVICACLVLATAYLVVAPRLYTGVASILIDARSRPAVGDSSLLANSSPDAILVESQVRLISSDPVLRRVVIAEKLDADPEFVNTAPGLRTRLLAAIGLGGHAAPSAEDTISRAVGSLATHVAVKRSERTYIADIEVNSRDPVKAARLANAVAKAYIADQQAARSDAADRDSEWVRSQVSDMQAGLQAAETQAEAYKREHGMLDANGKVLNEQELSEATTGLLQARAKAAETKARYDQVARVIASGRTIDTLPDALKSPAIDKLRSQYADISRQQATLRQTLGARHPALLESDQQLRDIRRLIAEELARIQAGLANENQTAQANVAMLDKQVQGLKATTVSTNGDRVRLDELQRDVDARRAVYDRFLRARDTVKEQASDSPIGRIIAPATTPVAPSSPKTFAILLLAAIAGLLLGVGGALLTHTLRTGSFAGLPGLARRPVRAAEAPRRDVEAPGVGFLPPPFGAESLIETRPGLVDRMRAAWPTAGEDPSDPVSPAFVSALHALPFDFTDQAGLHGITTLLVTAQGRPEARTMLALGLAEQAARQGRRALVIDAEEGRSLLRDLIEPGAKPDLLDLMGTTRMCYRVTTSGAGSFCIVPKLADEARLTQRLRGRPGVRHIEGLRSHFDVVVFDGPSVAEGERLRAMARSAQDIVFVATPEMSAAELDRTIEALDLPYGTAIATVVAADVLAVDASSAAA